MSAAMETACGRIRIHPPTPTKDYWRLEWYEHNRRRQSTGGRTEATARAKAAESVARLNAGSEPLGRTRLRDVVDAYLRWGREAWSENHYTVTRREVTVRFQPYLHLRAEAVDARLLKGFCNAKSTAHQAKLERSRLRAFLTWGHEEGYFTAAQTEALDKYRYVPNVAPVQKPQRRPKRTNGEGINFVTPDEVPSHAQVVALGDALQQRLPYGKLMIELAAGSGLRIGELTALQAGDVIVARRQLRIERQALGIRNRQGGRTDLPKGGKKRTAIYPAVSASGYAVADELEKHLVDLDPEALLFPAPRGGMWWGTGFTNDYFTPAATDAGWERLSWAEKGKVRYQWKHTMHSLRHRFAHDAIELWGFTPAELTTVGGWESIAVVFERYYGRSADILDRVFEKTGQR